MERRNEGSENIRSSEKSLGEGWEVKEIEKKD